MEDNLHQRNNKKLLILIPVLALVAVVVGVTYAFFNYTRTGASNTISTGSIYFNSVQTGSIEVSNFFPTDSNNATHGNNSSQMTVTITAGTSYEYGIDYSLTAVNVTRPTGTTTNIPVTVEATTSDAAIGFKSAGTHTITDTENFSLGTGHIAQTNSGNSETNGGLEANRVSGVITVTAYINASQVAITDTPEESTPWQGTRTVVNTTEWNRLAETPVTFQVRVVADEGAASSSVPTIASCPGCVYIHPNVNNGDGYVNYGYSYDYETGGYTISEDFAPISSSDYSLDYHDVVTSTSKNFLGVVLQENTGKATRAYACAVYINPTTSAEIPFCVEGFTIDENGNEINRYNENVEVLQDVSLLDNTCTYNNDTLICGDNVVTAQINSGGEVETFTGDIWQGPYCRVDVDSSADCGE